MQVNNFIQYLNDVEQLKTVSEDGLIPIIKEFPYCQTGQLMYAIQLNAKNSILFEEQLKKTASICADRNKLFGYIHELEDDVIEGNSIEVEQVTALSDVLVEEKNVVEKLEEPVVLKLDTITENKKNSILEKFTPVDGEDELAILEKEYLTEAINSSILIESEAILEGLPATVVEEKKEVSLFNDDSDHSFSSWLKHYSDSEDEAPIISDKLQTEDIINKFIQEDPRVKPEKSEFYSPINMARLSVTDSGIVSETLAVIHVDQGNFQMAIDTYEKLILKNPKKRSYFAAQIKVLKQKIK